MEGGLHWRTSLECGGVAPLWYDTSWAWRGELVSYEGGVEPPHSKEVRTGSLPVVPHVDPLAADHDALGVGGVGELVDAVVAGGHADPAAGGVVRAGAVDHQAVDRQEAARGHRARHRLVEDSRLADRLVIGNAGGGEAGEEVRARDDTGAAVPQGRLLQVEDDGDDGAGPLQDVAVEVIGPFFREPQGGVVVAVGDELDVRAEKG